MFAAPLPQLGIEPSLGPAVPENWYLLCQAKDVKPEKIHAFNIGHHDIVVFRRAPGSPVICFAAHCAHMGCNLVHGRLHKGALQCALHHRLIGEDGYFAGQDRESPKALKQKTYPVAEALGAVFVYCGSGEPPALPTPHEGVQGILLQSYAGEQNFPLVWQVLVANGFDVEHLSAVHERQLVERPDLQMVAADGIALSYHTRAKGNGLADKVTRALAPDGIFGKISSFGGSMMLVESTLKKRKTFILMSFIPDAHGGTTIRGIVGARSESSGLLARIKVLVATKLFLAFLRKDLKILEGLEWHEPGAGSSLGDQFTKKLCGFFKGLKNAN
jgi:aminopyrrolnitrin oxygenase